MTTNEVQAIFDDFVSNDKITWDNTVDEESGLSYIRRYSNEAGDSYLYVDIINGTTTVWAEIPPPPQGTRIMLQ